MERTSNESASPTAAEHLAAAERYAVALTRQHCALVARGSRAGAVMFGVDQSGRDYFRIFSVSPGNCRSIICFVGRGSGLVYRARSWKQRGVRVGHIDHVLQQFESARELFGGAS